MALKLTKSQQFLGHDVKTKICRLANPYGFHISFSYLHVENYRITGAVTDIGSYCVTQVINILKWISLNLGLRLSNTRFNMNVKYYDESTPNLF